MTPRTEMQMRQVTKDEFHATVGQLDVHPTVRDPYSMSDKGWESDWKLRDGTIVGVTKSPRHDDLVVAAGESSIPTRAKALAGSLGAARARSPSRRFPMQTRLERIPLPASGRPHTCTADDKRCGLAAIARVVNHEEISETDDLECPEYLCIAHVYEWEPTLDIESRLEFASDIADEADTQRGLG